MCLSLENSEVLYCTESIPGIATVAYWNFVLICCTTQNYTEKYEIDSKMSWLCGGSSSRSSYEFTMKVFFLEHVWSSGTGIKFSPKILIKLLKLLILKLRRIFCLFISGIKSGYLTGKLGSNTDVDKYFLKILIRLY